MAVKNVCLFLPRVRTNLKIEMSFVLSFFLSLSCFPNIEPLSIIQATYFHSKKFPLFGFSYSSPIFPHARLHADQTLVTSMSTTYAYDMQDTKCGASQGSLAINRSVTNSDHQRHAQLGKGIYYCRRRRPACCALTSKTTLVRFALLIAPFASYLLRSETRLTSGQCAKNFLKRFY